MYTVVFSRYAQKDKALLKQAGLAGKAKQLLNLMMENPYANPPAYEKLCGELNKCYSRRINRQHRIVYMVDDETRTVKILRMWTHYE